ncbi:hypothetical protein [Actinospica sp.]|jgi:hypothetical protein|uniref:hypothetical protein n=1 Tax=Actinospica sp. TaxID=1872142 RepID=UPI002CA5038C|nr:hypothetical protein [Actinospica sp.]HWG26128.1 hypothetical protein [Actinospica sp.]
MRRTSFVGALAAIAIGAVLAFAVHASPHWMNLQQAGFIVLLGGAADLIIRTLISDSPLLGPAAADVAAVVEPLGDPVLDAAGSPVNLPPHPRAAQAPEQWVSEQSVREPELSQHADVAAVLPEHDRAVYERALRAAAEGGTMDTPESEVAVTTITGRPVRPHTRRFGRSARSRSR